MEQGLQKLNADQRLAVWTQRIADCHSSGKGVKHWCQENNISEKTYYLQSAVTNGHWCGGKRPQCGASAVGLS